MGAKKGELSSELQQHLLSCELRRKNIETNIFSVRAGICFFTLSTPRLHLEMVVQGGKKNEQGLGEAKCWGVTSECRRWRNYLCEIALCSHRLAAKGEILYEEHEGFWGGGELDLRQICWFLANCEEGSLGRTGK